VSAIKVTDYDAITAAGIDRKKVANRLFEIYLQQIFEDGFFHADPHPGNLFVSPGGCRAEEDSELSEGWHLTFVDFGMTGKVPPQVKTGLREMALGVGTRDPERIVRSYQMIGVLLPGADIDVLIRAEEEAFNRFWGMSMSELQGIGFDEMEA
ncbi:MAG: AarF/ABC1/UbiB kinase family protein, partial [candidate division Zixibacteria bacterium]|nr:AarF/ABC1/UbiB kinase family protein [candidate division Zixibacteria bacterium]NIW44147.1 AarF/ABC1/UbiB kinase family protein [Gammaproteobacteria bacterium]NIR63219.1 AarF/ABC1/UbiB kinase family protein [candidate division Zixibacteria bacterium]NIS45206.1 AarF/ABC1/UbiB kinase family protein [candidate division Zixibacteria bacterium]NIT53375.1 AarF/ABC1/UbiB kinase family protein [candidate division Zixibacteria bacterium]